MTNMISNVRRLSFAATLLIAATLFLAPVATKAETIRVGHWSWPGYGFYYVTQAKQLAPDLDFEFTVIEDPVQLFGLLSTGLT